MCQYRFWTICPIIWLQAVFYDGCMKSPWRAWSNSFLVAQQPVYNKRVLRTSCEYHVFPAEVRRRLQCCSGHYIGTEPSVQSGYISVKIFYLSLCCIAQHRIVPEVAYKTFWTEVMRVFRSFFHKLKKASVPEWEMNIKTSIKDCKETQVNSRPHIKLWSSHSFICLKHALIDKSQFD